ncbi:histidine kinase [Winogradskyella maritima]|uniref:Histidine kinase n=1 Tax=Winogradskyella maritima TaxID=1517766 RepID=A0ABV8AER2_9FLAO
MKTLLKSLFLFSILLFADLAQGQTKDLFTVRGSVREKFSYEPIPFVNIEVNGGAYAVTGKDGNFKIKVKVGDQLVVKHKDFETVYYTIVDDERIRIEVIPEQSEPSAKQLRMQSIQTFNQLIDSADTYLKSDVERSVKFIADALDNSTSQLQNADAYETLGDIYLFWKQHDLAVSNYRISLQNVDRVEVQLKLAKAYGLNSNYQESIQIYESLIGASMSNYLKTELYQGYGDVLLKTKAYNKAIVNYQKGLQIAKNARIKSKITDFNSKIAQAYSADGNRLKAKGFFDNSLSLAQKETKERSVEEKVTVAEFNNQFKDYDDEIALRKEVVEEVKEIEKDSIITNESALTPQKQNYKIGTALFLQKNYDEAIPYLDKSIAEADSRGDFVVKKDAIKKKIDVYESAGDFEKAKAEFDKYTETVDALYRQKEQELAQVARFTRNIAENQNRITSLENERMLSLRNIELTEAKNQNQEIIIYSLIGGLILLLIAGYLTYKYIKQQRLANNLLALKSLRSQMNPHFIFNALNSVNSFIAINDERTANKYLSDFSFLMRAVLENSEEDFIPLEKEIELLELYTKLEHFRFKDKFDYSITIDDTIDVQEFMIPPMLLQPYIENAVWHGLRYKTEKGLLHVDITKTSKDEISISIMDDGIGRARSKAMKTDNQKKHNSKGLTNIKKRVAILNTMYKDKVDVSISDFQHAEDTGTKVVVTLKKD